MAWDEGATVEITPSWGAGKIQLDFAWTFAAVNSSIPSGAWWGPLTRLGRGATEGQWDFDSTQRVISLWVVLSAVVGHRLLIAGLDGARVPLTSGMSGTGTITNSVVPTISSVPFNWAVP